jgi:hypothetical protein
VGWRVAVTGERLGVEERPEVGTESTEVEAQAGALKSKWRKEKSKEMVGRP